MAAALGAERERVSPSVGHQTKETRGGQEEGRRLVDVAREASLAAERVAIVDMLRQVRWNRRKAAQMLGVSYKTLLNKIKETGIAPPRTPVRDGASS